MIVDRNTLATYFNLTPGRVTQLCREGVLSKEGRNQYDDAKCLQEYIAFKVEGHEKPASSDVNEARKKLYDAQVVKTELENDRTRRETVTADDSIRDIRELQTIFNTALDGFDKSLPGDIADLNDPAAVNARLTLATNATRQAVADSIMAYAGTLE